MRQFYTRTDKYDLIDYQKEIIEYVEVLAEALHDRRLWKEAVEIQEGLFNIAVHSNPESWVIMSKALRSVDHYNGPPDDGSIYYTLTPVADACLQVAYAKFKSAAAMANLVKISQELGLYELTAEPLAETTDLSKEKEEDDN